MLSCYVRHVNRKMQRKRATCEHNVKRLRTCKTTVSEYEVLLTVSVPTLTELCIYKLSQDGGTQLNKSFFQENCINNKIAQSLLHYLDDGQLCDVLSISDSFLCHPGLCNLKELCLAKRNIDGITETDVMLLLSHHRLEAVTMSESDITHSTLENMALSQQELSHLDLSFCLRIELFDSIFSFKNLSHLNLERTHFKLTSTTALNFYV